MCLLRPPSQTKMGIVDWNTVWNTEILVTERGRLNHGCFWDELAARDEDRNPFSEALTEFQLGRIAVQPEETLIEIGPGLGRLTLALARDAAAVTAVDPSAEMLSRLNACAAAAGVNTLKTVHCNWEDVELSSGLRPHSLIVASYSLFMFNMRAQLQRMLRLATNRICLFVPAEPRISEDVQMIIHGAIVSSGTPDHVVLFNLLNDMGLDPEVELFSFSSEKRYKTSDDALDEQMRYYKAPLEKRAEMRRHVFGQLHREDETWILRRVRKTAMLRLLIPT